MYIFVQNERDEKEKVENFVIPSLRILIIKYRLERILPSAFFTFKYTYYGIKIQIRQKRKEIIYHTMFFYRKFFKIYFEKADKKNIIVCPN